PLVNLLVNQSVGRWLFPYAHANRGAAVTYDPDTFVRRLDALPELEEPTFLAVHLTLVHWPYTWATAPNPTLGDDPAKMADRYWKAATRVDEQFSDLLQLLKRKGALDNSIVVVLSDHGESLGETLT